MIFYLVHRLPKVWSVLRLIFVKTSNDIIAEDGRWKVLFGKYFLFFFRYYLMILFYMVVRDLMGEKVFIWLFLTKLMSLNKAIFNTRFEGLFLKFRIFSSGTYLLSMTGRDELCWWFIQYCWDCKLGCSVKTTFFLLVSRMKAAL